MALSFTACGSESGTDAAKLSFSAASSYADLKSMDGQKVTINGYMATSSPVDGGYIFLMNLPYQNCPFCVPNTSKLSNTMAVYAKKNQSFDYTTQAIKVVGTFQVSDSEDKPFTDEYGYEFNYKIVDAEYTVLTDADISADVTRWQALAESGIVDEIYKMYDYLDFVCKWNTYYVNTYQNSAGETVKGYYLYPSDAEYYLKADGSEAYNGNEGQYHYGYKDGYFDNLIAKVNALDATAYSDLTDNITSAKALAAKALSELENKNYTSEYQYIEMFDNSDYVYTLTNGETLLAEFNSVYAAFEAFIAAFEM